LDGTPKSLAEEPGEEVSRQELDRIVSALKRESADAGKLTFIKTISHGRTFTCEQAGQLLKEFNFDPDREKATVAIYARLSDPQNFYRVLELFTFDSGRQSVRRQLGLN
jgi:hypothetical protein